MLGTCSETAILLRPAQKGDRSSVSIDRIWLAGKPGGQGAFTPDQFQLQIGRTLVEEQFIFFGFQRASAPEEMSSRGDGGTPVVQDFILQLLKISEGSEAKAVPSRGTTGQNARV